MRLIRAASGGTVARMDVAAFIVSMVALLVSGASVWYAYRQATAARDALAIERDRRHAELAPQIEASIDRDSLPDIKDAGTLHVRNHGPMDYATVEVELIEHGRTDRPVRSLAGGGARASLRCRKAGTHDAVDLVTTEHGGSVSFRFVCIAESGEQWGVLKVCPIDRWGGDILIAWGS
jgi:hypothetical protein